MLQLERELNQAADAIVKNYNDNERYYSYNMMGDRLTLSEAEDLAKPRDLYSDPGELQRLYNYYMGLAGRIYSHAGGLNCGPVLKPVLMAAYVAVNSILELSKLIGSKVE